ncbi:cytochrome oxidase biogenesis protein Surf1, facilitates heme A insertion [Loktanella sp. 3ANDIMAR09]|uniref:SURF1 family protein n=1 Tax=Loktanella sp. 3ANDIMAR09 TaxID=1225657 RepID=UPI0006F47B40|nr:SURF1 family protein [Loktanella sp. 3ANDIMAR09]KQI69361.1 cytochrome oxidase biogenesis protein Surf1, facilitates heme A insertion [Loktanella sp. 3ANDIMAR09]
MRKLIFPILLALSGTAILISLGVWQIQRLQWKTAILAQIETEIAAPPVAVPAAPDATTDRYLPVTATGTLTGDVLHVLVSTEENGAGYRTVSAFETDGRRVLLDLGFVGFDDRDIALPAGEITVTGNLLWPDEVDGFTPDPEPTGLWFARDADAMSAALGTEPFFIVARDIQPGSPTVPMPVGTSGIPNDHLSYAVTWFLLALGWLAMSGLFIFRTLRPKEH